MATQIDVNAAIQADPFWYHTIEVAPGVTTPGWFDLRPVVDLMPWPDVRGKRCLDVGTSDGFLAFELERRGAAEVVAVDLADHRQWDWPAHLRAGGVQYMNAVIGPDKGAGLRTAHRLLGSSVQIRELSTYDISPETVGEFDVVVCGSLLLHLRDPMRALAAIRSVCREAFLCTNQVELRLSVLQRGIPRARLHSNGPDFQWWVPNPVANRDMVTSVGFSVERETGIYAIPYGASHAPHGRSPRDLVARAARRVLAGRDGVPHHAVLARPADQGLLEVPPAQ